jgi:hypothetical protein
MEMICAKAGKFTKLFDALGNILLCLKFSDYEKEKASTVFAQYMF